MLEKKGINDQPELNWQWMQDDKRGLSRLMLEGPSHHLVRPSNSFAENLHDGIPLSLQERPMPLYRVSQPLCPWRWPCKEHIIKPTDKHSGLANAQNWTRSFKNVDWLVSYVSPALAFSTISWRRMTSKDLGREPAGISLEVSCMRTLCQSANLLSCRSNTHFALLAQVAFTHMVGCKRRSTFN